MNLEERLAAHVAKAGQAKEPTGRTCEASSYPTKTSLYGPDEVYRCQKAYAHKDQHEDDYGSRWVTYPRFKVVRWLGPPR